MSVALKNWGISIPNPYTAPEVQGFVLYGDPQDHPVEQFSDPEKRVVTSLVAEPGPGRSFMTQSRVYELVGPPNPDWLAELAAKGYRASKLDLANPFSIFGR